MSFSLKAPRASFPVLLCGGLFSALSTTIPASNVYADTTDGHPDFTGVWRSHALADDNAYRRGGQNYPLTDYGAAQVAEYAALIGDSGVTPGGMCLGTGMPGSMLSSGAYPMEIIQRPEQITVIYEAHAEIRRIFIGEDRFPVEERFPDRNGYSEAVWEGDTLVVTTTDLKEQVDQALANSDQAEIIERYELLEDEGSTVLKVEMTMTDPVYYEEPVVVTKAWARVDDARLLPYECNEPAWEEYLNSLREQQQ